MSKFGVVTKAQLEESYAQALPFVQPEYDLEEALMKCEDDESILAAVEECLANGGRKGCPAIESANKLMKDIAKAAKDGKPLPKFKPKRPAIGGGTPGWANQGEGRKVATTHDNSV